MEKNEAKWHNMIEQPVSLTPNRFHSSIMHQDVFRRQKSLLVEKDSFDLDGIGAPSFCDAVGMMVGRRHCWCVDAVVCAQKLPA